MRQSPVHLSKIVEHYNHTTPLYHKYWYFGEGYALHNGFYDWEHLTPFRALENTNRVLAAIVGITSHDTVLDAGCGVGGSALWIAQHTGAKVFGINISPLQIDSARARARAQGLSDYTAFSVHDYCDTQFPDSYFDVVWFLESGCHAENKEELVREAYRVLKPGGRLMVVDGFLVKPRSELNSFFRKILEKFEDAFAIGQLAYWEDFERYLRQAGFQRIEIVDKTSTVWLNFVYAFLVCILAYPFLLVLEKIKLVHPMVRKFSLIGIVQPFGAGMGIGRYLVFLARKN